MTHAARTVVIGLDGVPLWLLQALIEEGRMPNLAALQERGAYGHMRSTVNMMTPSAWTTMVTGLSPGRHGLFNLVHCVPERQDIYLTTAMDRHAAAIWELVGAEGRDSAVLRLPITFPARPLRGIMVADQLAPSPMHPRFTWPPELNRELVRKFGRLGWGEKADLSPLSTYRGLQRMARELAHGVKLTFDLVHYALDRGDYALVFAVVWETDTALHKLLPLVCPPTPYDDHFAHFPEGARAEAVRIFEVIDEEIGRLRERVGVGANMVVVSDHGNGPNDPGGQLLRPLLIELGYQGWREPPPPPTAGTGPLALLRRAKSAVARRIPWQVRRRLLPICHARREQGARMHAVDVIEWSTTRAFTVVAGQGVGEIWLNLKGRSRAGTVELGSEQEALIRELTDVLLGAVNSGTGQAQVERVLRREEVVEGPYAQVVPDLLAVFRTDAHCVELTAAAPDGRSVTVDKGSTGAWGIEHYSCHTPYGLFMASGPDIRDLDREIHCEIADVMPTLAYLLGCPIPRDLDGRLLTEVIRPEVLERRPPRARPPLQIAEHEQPYAYTDEERAEVERRLGGLGYV